MLQPKLVMYACGISKKICIIIPYHIAAWFKMAISRSFVIIDNSAYCSPIQQPADVVEHFVVAIVNDCCCCCCR